MQIRPHERAPQLAWLEHYDLKTYDRLAGWGAPPATTPHPFEYVVTPRRRGASVVATLATTGRGKKRFDVHIHDAERTLSARCNGRLSNRHGCPHVLAVLADLAVSAELRQAVLAGRSAEKIVLSLVEIRERALAAERARRLVEQWGPNPGPMHPLSIEIEVIPALSIHYYGPTEPGLAFRFRAPKQRRTLPRHDILSMPLHPDLLRLIQLCDDDPRGRRGFVVSGARAAMALEIVRNHPEWEIRGVAFSDAPVRLTLTRNRREEPRRRIAPWQTRAESAPPGTEQRFIDVLEGRWRTDDGACEQPAESTLLLAGPPSFVVDQRNRVFPVHPSVDTAVAMRVQKTPVAEVPEGAWGPIYQRLGARLRSSGVVIPTRASLGLPEAAVPSFALRIDGSPFDFSATLEATYDFGLVSLSPADPSTLMEGDPARNDELEQAATQRVLDAGLSFDAATKRFGAQEDAAVAFWEGGLARLRGEASPAVEVFLSEQLAGVRVRSAVMSRLRASLVGGWLETSVTFEADDIAAEMASLRDAIRRKRRWVLLRDGTLAPLAPEAMALANAVDLLLDESGHARLSLPQVGLLEHVAALAQRAELDEAIERLRGRLRALEVRPAALPARLSAELRPYQLQGLAWLQFLAELGAGGVLADDMGLGKTLMTLAFLAWKKESEGGKPALVVCPTSVVGNWLREAARFTPGLTTLSLARHDRGALFAKIGEVDLVVTTYGLLRLDIEQLEAIEFRAVVLDEAQNIKNDGAVTTLAARRLRGSQKLALSGTPVENRLGELWSILEFANPGMLGSVRSFEARFERPIAADPGGPAAAELRARVRPFVLRRTKAQVLAELPPKEEIDIACLPGPAQRKAYDALAAVAQQDVQRSIETRGFQRSGLIVLTALLRLRQMCCDPRLVDPARRASQSAKREAFLSLVRELVAEGRRALVFSQFVELLRLWREDLEREGIAYEYLDGATTRRDEVVARFQSGSAPLFLISLKAGGAGLNLTAADTVIHCDPWWNPAVEAQATDRAHRLGQSRAVTVYRLILRGSIEEKIIALKARKRALADAVISEDGAALRGLDERDVRALLSAVEEDLDIEEPAPEEEPAALRAAAATASAALPQATKGPVPPDEAERLVGEVQAHLRARGLAQKTFAAQAGLSQSKLSTLLNGSSRAIDRDLAGRMRRAMAE